MRLLMILGLSTFLAFLTSVASAATPIFYDETIDGPLPIHSDLHVFQAGSPYQIFSFWIRGSTYSPGPPGGTGTVKKQPPTQRR